MSVAFWVAWFLAFAAVELYSLRDVDDEWYPLTQVVRKYLPWFVTLPFLAWLLWHGVETYWITTA